MKGQGGARYLKNVLKVGQEKGKSKQRKQKYMLTTAVRGNKGQLVRSHESVVLQQKEGRQGWDGGSCGRDAPGVLSNPGEKRKGRKKKSNKRHSENVPVLTGGSQGKGGGGLSNAKLTGRGGTDGEGGGGMRPKVEKKNAPEKSPPSRGELGG